MRVIFKKKLYICGMEIDKKLYNEIKAYCDLNGLKVKDYINGLLRQAFNKDKYGEKPFMANKVQVTSVIVKANEVDAKGVVYSEEALKDAVDKFNEENSEKIGNIVEKEKKTIYEIEIPPEIIPNLDENQDDVSKSEKKTIKKRTIKPVK